MTGSGVTDAAPLHDDVADAPAGGRAFWMVASDGFRLRGAFWEGSEAGTVVILPGRTEFIEKYGRVIGRLRDRGFAVAAIDWRGQGLSQRREATPHLGHVDRFLHYQRDLDALLAHPDVAASPGPRRMLAHSMGACIGYRRLAERGDFASAVFTAPMFRLHLQAVARQTTAGARSLAARLRGGAALADGFAMNALTSDRSAYDWCAAQVAAHPELGLGAPSLVWVREALLEMERLRAAPPPATPILTLLGSDETVVSPKAIRHMMARLPQGRLVEFPGARHEILVESPAAQAWAWAQIDGFHAAHPG